MPFVFAISGASLYYAIGSRGALKFIDDKVRRLLVPLIVGVFSHAALMVYLERITHNQPPAILVWDEANAASDHTTSASCLVKMW
jgi:hypothetical protein